MSGGPKGAKRPLGRPLDGGVRGHRTSLREVTNAGLCRRLEPMKRIHSSWFHVAATTVGAAVTLAYPLIGVPILVGSVLLYKKRKREEDAERDAATVAGREKFTRSFRARQKYPSYEAYLDSDAWRHKRDAVLLRAGSSCEAAGCGEAATEVHHKWYPRVWGTEELDSLIALCHEHHLAAHHREGKHIRR